MADKIVVLRAGRVEQVGAPLELYNRPANTFVAGFIGSPRMNFLPAALLPATLREGADAVVPGGAHTVGIRPEHVRVDARAQLQMKVAQVEQLGASSLLHGSVGQDTPFEVVLAGQTTTAAGDTVGVMLPPQHLHAFNAEGQRI